MGLAVTFDNLLILRELFEKNKYSAIHLWVSSLSRYNMFIKLAKPDRQNPY